MAVRVIVATAVLVLVEVGDCVGVAVLVGVGVLVRVTVLVGVGVCVDLGVEVAVSVGLAVGVKANAICVAWARSSSVAQCCIISMTTLYSFNAAAKAPAS